MSDAPSGPFTSGLDMVMRGSVSFTVTPSVVGVAGGVAKGCATRAGLGDGATVAAAVAVAADGAAAGPQAATIVAASAALPLMSVTRRRSSRREIRPSWYS